MIVNSKEYHQTVIVHNAKFLEDLIKEKEQIDEIVVFIKYKLEGVIATFQTLPPKEF